MCTQYIVHVISELRVMDSELRVKDVLCKLCAVLIFSKLFEVGPALQTAF